jgi:hypothetical protein
MSNDAAAPTLNLVRASDHSKLTEASFSHR